MNRLLCGTLVCLSIISPVVAKTIAVDSVGYGISEEDAITNAIDNAVRQSNDVTISNSDKSTLVGNYQLDDSRHLKVKTKSWWKFWDKSKSEEIKFEYTGGNVSEKLAVETKDLGIKYKGIVENYNVKSVNLKNGKYEAKIKANVFVSEKYQSPTLYDKAKYTVVVTDFSGKRNWSCLSDTSLIRMIEKDIVNSKKFTVVDRENFDKQVKELNLVNKDIANKENLNKLREVKVADYLLVGNIQNFDISRDAKTIQLTGETIDKTSAKLSISYKLIETATMEIVSSNVVTESVNYDSNVSCNEILNSLLPKVSSQIINGIMD